jgi:hypothetical protein
MTASTAAAAAEDAMALNPLRASASRVERVDAVFTDQGPDPMLRTVARLRAVDSHAVDAVVADARAWFGRQETIGFTWWLGPSTTPIDVGDAIRSASGRAFTTITATAMVLDHEPPLARPGVEIRDATDYDDFAAALLIVSQAEDLPASDREALRARLPSIWATARSEFSVRKTFLALVNGHPTSAGTLAITASGHGLLAGGATVRSARGQGCYAALVAHRWQVATALSLDALIVQASEMSRPILETLGFQATAELIAIRDTPAPETPTTSNTD